MTDNSKNENTPVGSRNSCNRFHGPSAQQDNMNAIPLMELLRHQMHGEVGDPVGKANHATIQDILEAALNLLVEEDDEEEVGL